METNGRARAFADLVNPYLAVEYRGRNFSEVVNPHLAVRYLTGEAETFEEFADRLGKAFVGRYYPILHDNVVVAYTFYEETSLLSRQREDGALRCVGGLDDIDQELRGFGYHRYECEILTVATHLVSGDYSNLVGGGDLYNVVVTGLTKERVSRRERFFVQSFMLVGREEASDRRYMCISDILRFAPATELANPGEPNPANPGSSETKSVDEEVPPKNPTSAQNEIVDELVELRTEETPEKPGSSETKSVDEEVPPKNPTSAQNEIVDELVELRTEETPGKPVSSETKSVDEEVPPENPTSAQNEIVDELVELCTEETPEKSGSDETKIVDEEVEYPTELTPANQVSSATKGVDEEVTPKNPTSAQNEIVKPHTEATPENAEKGEEDEGKKRKNRKRKNRKRKNRNNTAFWKALLKIRALLLWLLWK